MEDGGRRQRGRLRRLRIGGKLLRSLGASLASLLSVIIPVYNEAATVARVIERVRAAAVSLPFVWRAVSETRGKTLEQM